jgi:uncharacterized membrane protein
MEAHGILPFVLPPHIVAGVLALVFGYVALFARKGAATHRRSGLMFVYAMVAMSLSGAFIAAVGSGSVSVVAGLLTFYFVVTSLLTVRQRTEGSFRVDVAAMLFALTVSICAFVIGLSIAGSRRPEVFPMFIFGGVGVLAAFGDLRMIRARGIQGPSRLKRHLWRMCFAMWVAAASFFWGPQGRVPEIIRIPALLPIPVLLPIAMMLYWLWRLRSRRTALHSPSTRSAGREFAEPQTWASTQPSTR